MASKNPNDKRAQGNDNQESEEDEEDSEDSFQTSSSGQDGVMNKGKKNQDSTILEAGIEDERSSSSSGDRDSDEKPRERWQTRKGRPTRRAKNGNDSMDEDSSTGK